MRLESLRPAPASALISEYVPECATPDWRDVTFENALNMATGVYDEPGFEADEDSQGRRAILPVTRHHAQRIEFACRHFIAKANPARAGCIAPRYLCARYGHARRMRAGT